jgi:hypothetical protein
MGSPQYSSSYLGSTWKRVRMPAEKWPGMWQWRSQIPGLSGIMSAIALIMGVSMIMSVRM